MPLSVTCVVALRNGTATPLEAAAVLVAVLPVGLLYELAFVHQENLTGTFSVNFKDGLPLSRDWKEHREFTRTTCALAAGDGQRNPHD